MANIINAITTGGGGISTTADASGSIQFATNNGTTAMTIDTSQNVGIGTNTAGQKLVVNGNQQILAGNYLALFESSNNNQWQLKNNTNNLTYTYNATEYMRIDPTGYVTNAVNGLGNGIVQAQQYYRLNSAVVGANVTTAQNTFGVGVTLIGSTQYEFEMVVVLNKTAGTTSHTISTLFGGTATLNNILCVIFSSGSDGALPTAVVGANNIVTNTAAATVISGAITSASRTATHIIKGTVSVNAGGTFIPQYQLSAAPGGAYTTQIGSYIKIAPLAASGANVSIGTWA